MFGCLLPGMVPGCRGLATRSYLDGEDWRPGAAVRVACFQVGCWFGSETSCAIWMFALDYWSTLLLDTFG